MLPPERQNAILARLAEHGSVRTVELAEVLKVTDETIRKDLEALEQRGELVRIHGGAVKPDRTRVELSLTERQRVNLDAKRAIARVAAGRIQVYFKQTQPLIDYYQKNGVLLEIDGDQPIDSVAADLLAALVKE